LVLKASSDMHLTGAVSRNLCVTFTYNHTESEDRFLEKHMSQE